jgi:hypothetical protein
MQLLRALRTVFRFASQPLRTETFHKFTNKQLATPELVRLELIKRIPFHSKISQVALYHRKRTRHAIKTCFSEKKYPFCYPGRRSSRAFTSTRNGFILISSKGSSTSGFPIRP